jgi:nitroreductase
MLATSRLYRALQRSFSSSSALPPAPSPSALASVFSYLVHARRSGARLDGSRSVPLATQRALVDLTSRAPSGFNLQPYTVVFVDEARVRARLAEAMLGVGNIERVAGAPLVAVFAADLDATASVPEVQEMEARTGQRSAAYLRGMPVGAAAFASSQAGGVGGACAAAALSRAAGLAGALTGAPLPPLGVPGIAWAYKQTALAAMTYLLAATSLGLATHPMEGLDHARAARAVGLAEGRFSVPLVVATGWPLHRPAAGDAPPPPTPRRPAVFRYNRASNPFPSEG